MIKSEFRDHKKISKHIVSLYENYSFNFDFLSINVPKNLIPVYIISSGSHDCIGSLIRPFRPLFRLQSSADICTDEKAHFLVFGYGSIKLDIDVFA